VKFLKIIQYTIFLVVATSFIKAEILPITASGELPLNISLLFSDDSDCPVTLMLVHRFLNLGSKYVSIICVAELESRLVPNEHNQYLWISPTGRSYKAKIGEKFSDGGRIWVIGNVDGRLSVESGRTRLDYEDGALAEMRIDTSVIRYRVEKGWTVSVSGRLNHLQLTPSESGYTITTKKSKIRMELNEWGSIKACTLYKTDGLNEYKFKYDDGFLSEVCIDGKIESVQIGECAWDKDYTRNRVFHPIVRSVGNVSIKINRDSFSIKGMACRNGRILASWKAVREGGGFRVTDVKGLKKMLLADVDAYVIDG
jgi:hypothetical protein